MNRNQAGKNCILALKIARIQFSKTVDQTNEVNAMPMIMMQKWNTLNLMGGKMYLGD